MKKRKYNKSTPTYHLRVRGKRLDKVDDTKLTLAYWLLAKQIVEERHGSTQSINNIVRPPIGYIVNDKEIEN